MDETTFTYNMPSIWEDKKNKDKNYKKFIPSL